jgi:Sec-independent protein secretion pathway component TatC
MATQTILAAPMLGLYGIGIVVAWVVQPRTK